MATFRMTRNEIEGRNEVFITVSDADLQVLELDRFDQMFLAEPANTAADYLLSLEIIFRRLNEQGRMTQQPQH